MGVELLEYTKYESDGERSELVQMMDPATAKMDLSFYVRNGLNNLKVNTMEYTFVAQPVVKIEGGEQLTMSLKFDSGARLDYIYTLYNSEDESRSYMLDFDIKAPRDDPYFGESTSSSSRLVGYIVSE